ncbi:uncharacterized protein LOC124349333 [Daphnia pulicaria]|uniref:uncharacterized protein LOC124349333 n=1 Tax=Daphnia pulicaria TaxID=35523 RepID=UPI001EEA4689|nr:uncharacterized protein LOC124349333 [Daphnia pulicaria]
MRPVNSSAGRYRQRNNNESADNNGNKNLKINEGLLRLFSVFNILLYNVCIGLEVVYPYLGQGIWGSSIHMVSGLLGFGASYRPTRTRLSFVMAFSCLSILFGFIVSGLSWAGYTYCDPYYSYENHKDGVYIVGDCPRPASQLALMIVNIVAIVISSFVVALVSNPLCCANQSATQNLHSSTIRISTIDMPADTPDLSTGTRTVISSTGIHLFSSHRPKMEILSRLALFSRRQEEEERPPRYSIAVAESDWL